MLPAMRAGEIHELASAERHAKSLTRLLIE
jgi:hypothetical protein